jgi:hypothetical protein
VPSWRFRRKRHETPNLNCCASRRGVGHAGAQALDDRAFASKDEAKIREVEQFMDSIFEQLDQD